MNRKKKINRFGTCKKNFFWFYRAIIQICIVSVFGACSGEDALDDDNSKNTTQASFSVSIKENFANSPLSNLNNVRVGERLRYDIIIKNKNKDSKLVFDLNNSDQKGHRRLYKDYKAYFVHKDTLESLQAKEENHSSSEEPQWLDSISVNGSVIDIPEDGEYVLFIKPLVPGTFTHLYTFGEKEFGSDKYEIIGEQVNFNCIDVSAWVQPVKTRDGSSGVLGIGSHASEHHNEYFIRINDGDNENDLYLASKDGRSQTCKIEYDGQVYEEKMEEGSDICFLTGPTTKRHPANVTNRNIDKITIRQKDAGRDEVIIELYNITLNIKPE